MGCLRPATPGFLVTLAATIILAIVSFCVPYVKSVYFLKASITQDNVNGSIIFGTLGYCLELFNGTTCSKPQIGYELDINSLVDNKLPIKIPQIAVKWLTTALVLHIVALIAAAGSALFGLLAHVREMSMTCCSTCVSGFAAVVALLAFIFDLILFFVAKARINAVGSAQIGSAIWLTLAAWVLLFFSGCFYSFGRCCISNRPSTRDANDNNRRKSRGLDDAEMLIDRNRLDAVKAESDRKAFQQSVDEISETRPLTGTIQGNQVHIDGYVPGEPGNRAVEGYEMSYPPQPSTAGSSYASNALPPAAVNSVPQFPTTYGQPYGYQPSPPPAQMDRNQGPPYFTSYPQHDPYGDNSYGEFRPGESYNPFPLISTPPIPSEPTPPALPSSSNQRATNPYLMPSSPPLQSYQPENNGNNYGTQMSKSELPPPGYTYESWATQQQ